MIIDFDDYDGYNITSMIAAKLPNLMDCITIKTSVDKFLVKL